VPKTTTRKTLAPRRTMVAQTTTPTVPPGTATAVLYYQAGGVPTYMYNSIFRDENVNFFSDENPNSCSVM